MSTPLIAFETVSKSFARSTVVDRVSLTIPSAKTVVLIGPSGCGKSTLLALLMGLIAPDSGRVTIDGAAMTPASARSIRRRIGYVIQDGGLFPHLTARQNIVLMARELGWPSAHQADRLQTLCALTRFPESGLDRYPVELSGGQRQRVSLMRALMLDPDILVLDEPLGALDPMIRAELQDDLKAIFESLAKTVLLVTHDLGEAAYFADHIVLMDAGRVVQEGDFDDLLDRPAAPFVTRFVKAQARRA